MPNVFSLGEARASRENATNNEIIEFLEDELSAILGIALRDGQGPNFVIDELIKALSDCPSKTVAECTAAVEALNDKYLHVTTHLVTVMPSLLKYLSEIEADSTLGGSDVMVTDTTKDEPGQPFPDPMLMYSTGCNPKRDGSIYAAMSISARSIVFDGEFQDYDGPAVMYHPKTKSDFGLEHIDALPTIEWVEDFDSARRGLTHPLAISDMLKRFLKVGINCNGGLAYKHEDGRQRFHYLQAVTPYTIIEWSVSLSDEVYTITDLTL